MTNKPFAQVIVDVSARKLDRIFHYSIPPEIDVLLKEGARVVVPFGSRIVEGYVVGFSDVSDVSAIKPINDVLDPETWLPADLLALAGWMADRYMCSTVAAIRSLMPAGVRTIGQIFFIPADSFEVVPADMLANLEREVYNYICNRGKTPQKEVYIRFKNPELETALRELSSRGLIEVIREIKPRQKPRQVRVVELALDRQECEKVINDLKNKAPKQSAVLRAVYDQGIVPAVELPGLAGTTATTVRELIKKGYLAAKTAEIRRDPYALRRFARTEPLKPTPDQEKALHRLKKAMIGSKHETFLLHGVTGSGKTEVYLQAIDYCIKSGKQAIVLVPEISLTPQMVERFKGRFGNLVAVLHSRLSAGERYDEWRHIKKGSVRIVVGARSAVFAPFNNLGLIIIDEEHETSYKQEDNPKYHARDVAVARGKLTNSVVVLGSATPSLESYSRALAGRYGLLTIEKRIGGQVLPEVALVDMREEIKAGHRNIFSRELIERISNVLLRKEQVILFLNRRGYATFVVCRECGLVMRCPRCSITLTLHAGENMLRCHYCDFQRKTPELCPACNSASIRQLGVGTQKVESEIARWFPDARVARMDMDTTTGKGSHEKILNSFQDGAIDILVGTQMIAKGLDFPGVTLVGVISADTALNLPDFRAAERTFQLLTQVAGRAGRGERPGEVIVQTYSPEHYSVVYAKSHAYRDFFKEELQLREILEYPPYCSFVRIVISGKAENNVIQGSEVVVSKLSREFARFNLGVTQPLMGPAPAPLRKLRNHYRWQICVRGTPGSLVRKVIREELDSLQDDPLFAALKISTDVDPLGMM
ncbi:primosomal protein N' [Phosphitispora sp. TUW77]|uniref:primosomal protein N' n=1 Tax=Phosphitispora sp. TUW77 TaxID=3152361 RepID=UPI003AB81BB6